MSAWVLDRLARGSAPVPSVGRLDGLGEDVQLALYLCYGQQLRGLDGAEDLEWSPELIAVRGHLERAFEEALRELVPPTEPTELPLSQEMSLLIEADTGPSLSQFMEATGSLQQMRQFVVHRSGYQLHEGDAHTCAIPRLGGRAKQLLVQIQAGEYGADEPGRMMHSALFARTMRALGLDDRPDAYLGMLPASALALSNLISLFGLNRRWRSALVGHLTLFEMTSVEPMGRYSRALRRMGADPEATQFYDVHVLADAEHELLALEMAEAQALSEPAVAPDVLFGARCALEIERNFAEHLFLDWGLPHAIGRAPQPV